jgi:aryl-alcohol dehydrogenase-like predicted oxidoreductase
MSSKLIRCARPSGSLLCARDRTERRLPILLKPSRTKSEAVVSRQTAWPCSRRRFLELSVLSGTAAVLPYPARAGDSPGPVITKPIPATGEKIPVMGIGTNQFGRMPYDDVRAILQRMHQLGGAVIDTAAQYGESEVQIGKALTELNLTSKMFTATKLNAPGGPGDGVGGLPSFERSVQRLQKVDLLFIHFVDSVEAMMPLVTDLKKQGKVRYIGITSIRSSQYPQLLEYMRKYPMDFLQVNYSLGDRSAEAEVLPLAQERKIAVMAAVPLGGGRNLLIKQTGDRQLPSWAAQFGIASWSQFFLKYVVSHPAISCAIPGSSKLEHLEDNQAAGHGHLLDTEARRQMEALWAQTS